VLVAQQEQQQENENKIMRVPETMESKPFILVPSVLVHGLPVDIFI